MATRRNLTLHYDAALLNRVVRWYVRSWLRGTHVPVMAHISATSRCNYHCRTCPRFQAGTLPLELYERAVEDLGRLGTYFLYLLGGEPLLLDDIFHRVRHAKQHLPYVHLVTNGSLLDAAAARQLGQCGIDAVSVSVDGLERTCDANRGPGAFRRAMDALRTLKRHAPRVKAIAATQVAPWNIDELPALVQLMAQEGFEQRFQPTIYFPELARRIERQQLVGADAQQLQRIDAFVEQLSSVGHVANRSAMLDVIPLYYRAINGQIAPERYRQLRLPIFDAPCQLPAYYVDIFPDGDVRPCWACPPGSPDRSLHRRRLRQIILDPDYQALVRRLRSCKKCRDDCMSCYITPQLFFPLGNYARYLLWPQLRRRLGRLAGRPTRGRSMPGTAGGR